jgi:outer membrane receptor for ferrienterochelin and colicin
MRSKYFLLLLAAVALMALPAIAQNPTGTLTGSVTDGREALPGVTVTVSSPNLQGKRVAVSSINGDYIFRFLPPGEYQARFELQGFQTIETTVKLSAAQTARLDATMPQAAVAEEVTVTGAYETVSTTSTAATTYEKDLIEKLPVNRDLASAVLLTPGVHGTGPGGNATISGAMSYENLYLVNGVVVNENIRGQAVNVYIEDAIQETTTSVAGVSSEYGRFAGGVINVLTKSGGNEFHATTRLNLGSEKWQEKTPMTPYASQSDTVNKTWEATVGGFILKDKLWYFMAGRYTKTDLTFTTYKTRIVVPRTNTDQRVEGKLTFSATPDHRFIASYTKRSTPQKNYVFTTGAVDMTQFYDRNVPESLLAINYNGVLSENLFVEAQYSTREQTFMKSGGRYTDLIRGTAVVDNSTGAQGNAPTFCGVCRDELRDNKDYLLKGSYFLSTAGLGSHDIVFGVDRYEDLHTSDNHQSGSDWTFYLQKFNYVGQSWYPTVNTASSLAGAGSYMRWWPILYSSKGSNFTTDSIFINDRWRLGSKVTLSIGARYDKNDGTSAYGKTVSKDSKISPRLGFNFDPWGDGRWTFNASFAHYVMSLLNSGNIADVSPAGSPSSITWWYGGPTIDATNLTSNQVVEKMFEWFNNFCNAEGKCGKENFTNAYSFNFPGFSPVIEKSLRSPYAQDLTVGTSKRFGNNALVRLDYTYREFKDLYETRALREYGYVSINQLGLSATVDKQTIHNSDYFERVYHGVNLQGNVRFSDFTVGGNWTWSHAYGNYNGEGATTGPVREANPYLYYPEYRDAKWTNPRRNLSIDQRNNARVWVVWDAFNPKHNRLSLSALHSYFTGGTWGTTIGAATSLYVTNPGYKSPPRSVTYTAEPNDTYKLDDIHSTNFSINYSFIIPAIGKDFEFYLQPEVINIFNHRQVTGVNTTTYDATSGSSYAAYLSYFNPLAGQTPKECPKGTAAADCKAMGAHWQKGPDWGKPTGTGSYQAPRLYRVSFGIRF